MPDSPEALYNAVARAFYPLVRRWRLLLGWSTAAALLVALTALLLPPTYSVTVGFVPEASSSALGAAAGLAAQLGVSLPSQDPTQSAEFYERLLRSRELYRALVVNPYTIGADSLPRDTSLLDVYDTKRRDVEAIRVEEAVERLRQDLRVRSTARTQWVELTYQAHHPGLAFAVTDRALQWLDSFNIAMRRSSAAAEVVFIEGRVREVQESLQAAEARTQRFMDRNREFRSWANLSFEFDRLNQVVTGYRELAATLQQALERAKIEAVRTTSVITVVEPPRLPSREDRRRVWLKATLGFFLTFCLIGGGLIVEAEWGVSPRGVWRAVWSRGPNA